MSNVIISHYFFNMRNIWKTGPHSYTITINYWSHYKNNYMRNIWKTGPDSYTITINYWSHYKNNYMRNIWKTEPDS